MDLVWWPRKLCKLCCQCDRNLKLGTQYDTCGRWFRNICGNVKAQVTESGKWICDKCRLVHLRFTTIVSNTNVRV
jgi:hypothetical protein